MVQRLCDQKLCTGCTACASICPKGCIQMQPDAFGFLYPQMVDPDACIDCGLCTQSCPVLAETQKVALPKAYAAMAADTKLRLQSSSGGVFSLLAQKILEEKGAVFGAAYDADFAVHHICVETVDDLRWLRGAKYSQSNLNTCFRNVRKRLNQGQKVLFSGTPCQVAGLKTFLRKDYENLLTVDFVCHSIPSPEIWKAYVHFRADQDNGGKMPVSINLRSKESGWSRYQYENLFRYNERTYSQSSGSSLYMKLFVSGFISRESCATCHFKGYHRVSDLTLGDFWGIWDIAPEMDDNHGTSLVLVQSEKGARYFKELCSAMRTKPVTLEQASAENQALLVSIPQKENRETVMQAICAAGFEQSEKFLPQTNTPTIFSRIKAKLIRMIHK